LTPKITIKRFYDNLIIILLKMTFICISGERRGHKGQFTDSPIPGKGSSINDVTKCRKIYKPLSSQ
jgi:hypothetical protein